MVIGKDTLVKSFERRYDFVSARAVYSASLESSGLKDKDSYTAADVASICAYLQNKNNTEGLIDYLQAQVSGGGAPKKEGAKPAPKKEEAKPAAKKEEAKPAAKKEEAKPAPKKPAQPKKPSRKGKGD